MSRHTRLLTALLAASALALHAAPEERVLFKDNFDRHPVGPISPGSITDVIAWEGPAPLEFGWVGITEDYPMSGRETRDRLRVVALHDNTPSANRAPSVQFLWSGKAPTDGRISVEWSFLVPELDPYTGIFFLGNHWNDSSAAIILSNGRLLLHHDKGDATRKVIGAYTPGKWHTLKADLDVSARTIDVWFDGNKAFNGGAWLTTAPRTTDRLSIVSDFAPVDRAGGPVLYIDDVKAAALP